MGHCVLSSILLSILIFSLLQSATQAAKKSYIVYLGAHSHGPNPSSVELESVTNSHYNLLGSYLGSVEKAKEAIFYSYNRYINGFAAVLNEPEASEIAKHPDVISVFLSEGRQLHTTHSWEFLGVERNDVVRPHSIWKKARYGEDTIIGNLDSGVWPESKSFSDQGLGPIPSKWRGICQQGVKDKFPCNRKLLGARYFNKAYIEFLKWINATFALDSTLHTARDYMGHGSHTLSTAGGNFVTGANALGIVNGTAKGGSPKARVATYKVCGPPIPFDGGCFDADILAGFEAAIGDGVDVLSVSLGGAPREFFRDVVSIGALHAVKNGIVVVASAGNSGPTPSSVCNGAPWLVTVGASTIDREFTSYVALGNRKHLKGKSLSSLALPSQKFYPLISGSSAKVANVSDYDALLCNDGTLDPKKVKGKILVCLLTGDDGIEKSQQAVLAGAIGFILANDEVKGNEIIGDPHFLPASHVNYTDGQLVFAYLNSTKTPVAYLTQSKAVMNIKPATLMAEFSSRGPNSIEPAILKPDITAPGVDIIAAFTEAIGPSHLDSDKRRVPFSILSGTSMSCPHVSGVAGLLRTLHPDWSPAAIRSAIMTSASTGDNNNEPLLNESKAKATPFAYGSGHIQPNQAADPGLIYDLNIHDYLNFLCAHGYDETQLKLFSNEPHKCSKSFTLADFNYPSISVPSLGSEPVIVTRRVKNVGPPTTYNGSVSAPVGVSVIVKPTSLKFSKSDEEKNFKIVLKANAARKPKDYVFGDLKWTDGKHYVRSPIAVKF